ncbi:hypothetical protein EGW08_018907 [Elysia chlorotica]|uniref:Uncharacterized protein n=1 Tax=Elysia chlorotica TaxID=188477 RepID=A0A433SVM4_ELYCH|nr:hypothetical protein EGW08_018907 [Elysia chlorotica]
MQTSSSSVSSSSSSRPQPAAHPTYPRVAHASRSGSSTDLSRPRDDQLRLPVSSKLDVQVTSEQERSRTHPLPHSQPQKNISSVKPAEPASSQVVAPDDVFSPNCYSPAAVRPPSPPFPPPSDLVDDEETGSGPSAGRVASPDTADTGSSGLPPAPASGPKLSLSDYRQRYHAKLSERSIGQAVAGAQEDRNPAALEHSFTPEQFRLKSAPSSPAEDKPFQAGADHSFSKLQDSPSNPGNPRITLKVKRDPASGESLSVKYSEGLRIKIKPPRPTIEGEGTTSVLDQSAGVGTPREEGEILEDSPSPASSTGSARRSEGLRIRLSVPKASDNNSSGISSAVAKRESDHWSSRESGHRSHHHGHHSHRSHHKSKKHKEHRSRHEGKSSGHHSSKRQCGHSYDERQAKLPRVSTSYGGMGGPPPPPLPPLPPPPSHHALQHQNSGFSINDAFVSSFPTGHDVIPDYGEDANLPAPTTPLEGIPPHHEPFHRMLEEHRAREEAKRPPLPPVPPPPPPPSFPPPPPPPSM